jgi:hypothetical protein
MSKPSVARRRLTRGEPNRPHREARGTRGFASGPRRQMVTARVHVGGHGRVRRRHHAKNPAPNDSKFRRVIREAVGAGARRVIPRQRMNCAVAACVILRSAEGLSDWRERRNLNRGVLGKTPSAVSLWRHAAQAPMVQGSIGEATFLPSPTKRREGHAVPAACAIAHRDSDAHSTRLRSRAPSRMRTTDRPTRRGTSGDRAPPLRRHARARPAHPRLDACGQTQLSPPGRPDQVRA